MAKNFGATLSSKQIALARAFEAAHLTTFSQAVKAFERDDSERIATWKQQLQLLKTYVADKNTAEELAYAEDAVRFPAPVVVEEVTQAETVTVVYQSFEMDMTAQTTEEDIAAFVTAGAAARFDSIDTDAIAERAWRLSQERGYITSSGTLLTDADDIESTLLDLARRDIQDDIAATVAGLIEARDEAFGQFA